ncbi:MAG TPA: JDVT-CTERM system glutamic-type intramembrane protease [Gallionellaceae bacterium]|nr:JDVT-CTERM system glutamic-type intramembrane protease [Gallionellaceae bacterium]
MIALVVPLLVWPWVPAWNTDPAQGWGLGSVALFVLTPITEEILFRGFMQGWLLNRGWFKKLAAGASRANWCTSIAFACAHAWQHALILVPGYFAVSLLLGHFRERYRGILVPVLLHGYYNLGLLLFTACSHFVIGSDIS